MKTIKLRILGTDGKWMYLDVSDGEFQIPPPPKEYKVSTLGLYTGLHDEDGKEIWEGDILQKGKWLVGVVEFRFGCFVVEFPAVMVVCIEPILLNNQASSCKVIGNIHENPELLKEEL